MIIAGDTCDGTNGLCKNATIDFTFMYSLNGMSGSGFLVFYPFSSFSTTKYTYGANTLGQSWYDGSTKQVEGQRPALSTNRHLIHE